MTKADKHAVRHSKAHGYLTEFLRMRCAPTMLAAGLFPNAKEVTESFAARHAVNAHVIQPGDQGDDSIVLVAPGDGVAPRTAATFALTTRWRCISVDPLLRDKAAFGRIDRLECVRVKAAEMPIVRARRVIVAAVHSHAALADTLSRIEADRIDVVALPCCVALETGLPPSEDYQDDRCLSPQRRVLVWRDVRGAS